MSRAFDRESIPELSNADLDACCGTVTVARGLAYAQRDHVIDLDASPDHREVEGHVIGSNGQTYLTTVRLRPDTTSPWLHHWSSRPRRRGAGPARTRWPAAGSTLGERPLTAA